MFVVNKVKIFLKMKNFRFSSLLSMKATNINIFRHLKVD